jgi:hypothetical protein
MMIWLALGLYYLMLYAHIVRLVHLYMLSHQACIMECFYCVMLHFAALMRVIAVTATICIIVLSNPIIKCSCNRSTHSCIMQHNTPCLTVAAHTKSTRSREAWVCCIRFHVYNVLLTSKTFQHNCDVYMTLQHTISYVRT